VLKFLPAMPSAAPPPFATHSLRACPGVGLVAAQGGEEMATEHRAIVEEIANS
jgi:hypothetical protein